MKTIAIIAEFNPFHNGHAYLIREAKKQAKADFCVILMSGCFVQRGAPAAFDKRLRAKMALLNGADLILELPVRYACANASVFAQAAVSILSKSGIIDELYFGSEHGSLPVLDAVSDILIEEPSCFREEFLKACKNGMSFPAARTAALKSVLLSSSIFPADVHFDSIFSQPNNLLGIEYLNALKRCHSPIIPHTISRVAVSHHDFVLPSADSDSFQDTGDSDLPSPCFASATAVRNQLSKLAADPDSKRYIFKSIRHVIPESVYRILSEEHPHFCSLSDFSELLYFKILSEQKHLTDFGEIKEDFSKRLQNLLSDYTDIEHFLSVLKTKNITHSSISRNLMQLLLGIPSTAYPGFGNPGFLDPAFYFPEYFQILGVSKNALSLVGKMKQNSSFPVIMNPGNEKKNLSGKALEIFEENHFATQLYRGICSLKNSETITEEYSERFLIL